MSMCGGCVYILNLYNFPLGVLEKQTLLLALFSSNFVLRQSNLIEERQMAGYFLWINLSLDIAVEIFFSILNFLNINNTQFSPHKSIRVS